MAPVSLPDGQLGGQTRERAGDDHVIARAVAGLPALAGAARAGAARVLPSLRLLCRLLRHGARHVTDRSADGDEHLTMGAADPKHGYGRRGGHATRVAHRDPAEGYWGAAAGTRSDSGAPSRRPVSARQIVKLLANRQTLKMPVLKTFNFCEPAPPLLCGPSTRRGGSGMIGCPQGSFVFGVFAHFGEPPC